MTMTVWKFPLRLTEIQEIELSSGARIIKVDVQHGVICLWAWCNPHPEATKVKRRILIVGTGHDAPTYSEADYLGSVLTSGGDFVWHVFEWRS